MATSSQTIVKVQVPDIEGDFEAFVEAVSGGRSRVIIERGEETLGALVSPADLKVLTRLDRGRDELFDSINQLRSAFKNVSPEELECEADRAVAELRGKAPIPA